MNQWHDLFVATAGASAALTGLIFVGVSINLTKILSIPTLVSRALIPLILLMTILVISITQLIPIQTFARSGLQVLTISVLCFVSLLSIDISILKKTNKEFWKLNFYNLLYDLLVTLPYIVGAVFLFTGCECGLSWVTISIILSFIKSMSDAWVLLIEINR